MNAVLRRPMQRAEQPAEVAAPAPTKGKMMPFRPENIMTTIMLLAALLLVAIFVFAAVALAIWGGEQSTPAGVYIGGMVLLALKVVLAMLQTEHAKRQIEAKVDQVAARADQAAVAAVTTARAAGDAAIKVGDRMDKASAEIADSVKDTNERVRELEKHTNGELTKVVEAASEKARAAERDQVINDPECADKLKQMIAEALREVLEGGKPGGGP